MVNTSNVTAVKQASRDSYAQTKKKNGVGLTRFFLFYRATFPETTVPIKMHLLEDIMLYSGLMQTMLPLAYLVNKELDSMHV